MLVCVMAAGGFGTSALAEKKELDDTVKQSYYAEYIKIAEEVGKKTGSEIQVLPMDEFAEDDWKTPKEFRKMVAALADGTDCTEFQKVRGSSVAAAKTAEIKAGGETCVLSVTGSFYTNIHVHTGRQHFAGITSMTSELLGGSGTWKQTGFEYVSLDSDRTYGITVSGDLTAGGVKFVNKRAYAEFYCGANGNIE